MDSQVLTFQKKHYTYFELFKEICAVYETTLNMPNPFKTNKYVDFLHIVAYLQELQMWEELGTVRGMFLFITYCQLWEEYKQEFVFDPSLAEEICDLTIPENLPKEVISKPPFPVLYIRNPFPDEISDGWFFMLSESDLGETDLIIMALKQQGTAIHFKTWALELTKGTSLKEIIHFGKREGFESLYKGLNLYLYLCSQTPEIDKAQKVQSGIKVKKGWRRKEALVSKVGIRIGTFLRTIRKTDEKVQRNTGLKCVGHLRRAHWHHYWIGKKESQELVLRWVHPILINGGEVLAKLNKVKQ